MDQILIKIFGFIYSFIALPGMAIIAVAYYRKTKTLGGIYFSIGAIATAIGSMYNQVLIIRLFMDQATGVVSPTGKVFSTLALILHLAGFLTMVAAWGIITFSKEEKSV
jgi:hypothetical protein